MISCCNHLSHVFSPSAVICFKPLSPLPQPPTFTEKAQCNSTSLHVEGKVQTSIVVGFGPPEPNPTTECFVFFFCPCTFFCIILLQGMGDAYMWCKQKKVGEESPLQPQRKCMEHPCLEVLLLAHTHTSKQRACKKPCRK